MNPKPPFPLGPEAPLCEILLADTAIRIELPASLHRLAVERYGAVRKHIERAGSPLEGRVALFYPQGSMAIRTTIKARKRDEGYDIDIIAELLLSASTPPGTVLELLFDAINGPKGSRYHGMVKRQTRCVTVEYEDGMHLDVTPSILIEESDPRKSHIFHAKEEEHSSLHKRLLMNTFAFIDWFNMRAPVDVQFSKAYQERALAFDRLVMKAEAPAEPVPNHSTEEGGKSSTVIALQLLKRNRNIRYANRDGRMPPSVMMACLAGLVASPGNSICGALGTISHHILRTLEQAQVEGRLVDVRNPKCPSESFTDRWPESLTAQKIYINDLHVFRGKLAMLMDDNISSDKKRLILIDLFGEGPAGAAFDAYAETLASGIRNGTRRISQTGRIVIATAATAPALIKPAAAVPSHTFFGTPWLK